MSLTSQLRDGALGAWCAAALTGAPSLVDQVQAAGRGREPVRPTGNVDPDHWGTIGGAFGQRLAFLMAHEPPYAAYLGAANAGLLGGAMLDTVVNRWPAHRPLGARQLPDQPGMADDLLDAFTVRLADHLVTHAPPGTLADTRDAEDTLACACWVLTGWEAAYRGGAIPPSLSYTTRDLASMPSQGSGDLAVDALLTEAPVDHGQELVTLAGRLNGSGTLGQLRALAGHPPAGQSLGVAAPVFVPHWAEGDVIVGDTLIDVKTVITLWDRDRIGRWLFQLLAYAWLDEADRYRIRNVGLYLARHGALLTWPLDAFAETLVNVPGCVVPARREFLDHAHDAMGFEGAVPFTEPAGHTRIA